jgi:hypothetical protein
MRCARANGGHIGGGELDFARQRSHQLGARVRQNFADLGQANFGLAIGNCFRGTLLQPQRPELTSEGVSNTGSSQKEVGKSQGIMSI